MSQHHPTGLTLMGEADPDVKKSRCGPVNMWHQENPEYLAKLRQKQQQQQNNQKTLFKTFY